MRHLDSDALAALIAVADLGSFTAACVLPRCSAAAALETLRIIEEDRPVENAARSGAHLRARLKARADHPLVGNVRGVGLIAGVELVLDKDAKTGLPGQPGGLGLLVNARLQELGVLTRAMGDTIGFSPPLIITLAEVDALEPTTDRYLLAAVDLERDKAGEIAMLPDGASANRTILIRTFWIAAVIAFYSTQTANWSMASALGIVLLVITLILYVVYVQLSGRTSVSRRM